MRIIEIKAVVRGCASTDVVIVLEASMNISLPSLSSPNVIPQKGNLLVRRGLLGDENPFVIRVRCLCGWLSSKWGAVDTTRLHLCPIYMPPIFMCLPREYKPCKRSALCQLYANYKFHLFTSRFTLAPLELNFCLLFVHLTSLLHCFGLPP